MLKADELQCSPTFERNPTVFTYPSDLYLANIPIDFSGSAHIRGLQDQLLWFCLHNLNWQIYQAEQKR